MQDPVSYQAPLASPPANALANWQCLIDPQSHYPYYYNSVTGVSQWEPPPGWATTNSKAQAPDVPRAAADTVTKACVHHCNSRRCICTVSCVRVVSVMAVVAQSEPSAAELEARKKLEAESEARAKAEADAALAKQKADAEAAARRLLEEELAAMRAMVCMLQPIQVVSELWGLVLIPLLMQMAADRQAKAAAEAAANEAHLLAQSAQAARAAAEAKADEVSAAAASSLNALKSTAATENIAMKQAFEAEAAAKLAAVRRSRAHCNVVSASRG